jgi:hypothetical protein
MSIVQKLTEGIVNRDLSAEGAALIDKWEQTGLLEGLHDDHLRNGMACLLENQAKELLREASTMSGGDVEGFAAVAFPLVRRVFGALIANDLVSVQPMSLPSGLIFLTAGTKGVYGSGINPLDKAAQWDPDLTSGSQYLATYTIPRVTLAANQFDFDDLIALDLNGLQNAEPTIAVSGTQLRRLTHFSGSDRDNDIVVVFKPTTNSAAGLLALTSSIENAGEASEGGTVATAWNDSNLTASYVETDNFTTGLGDPGSVIGAVRWGLENNARIPEIDIKIDSLAVTAMTKKLKAKWTPELGQDLNAYHNLDAEVELTQILSEQVALEIDREILEDLIRGATAGVRYWSRAAGRFVNRETGVEIGAGGTPDFTGNVSEWYETLVETINDVSAQIHRKTLRGAANFIVVSPEVANILEFTAGFRANVTADSDRGDVGTVKVGSLSKKFDCYVDPYFPRNLVLVGRRGGSFLESGYVYAPYVPLQTTPTIFGVEDFVPRKGVMTRYAKKMVRPDMYGLVVVRDLV